MFDSIFGKNFNYIFENNEYPKTWTKGIIVPIPKRAMHLMLITIGDNDYERICQTFFSSTK